MINIADTEEVVDLLARPCKRCGADLFLEHASRQYCEGCNPQDHASRDMRTEEQRKEDEKLEQLAIDYWLAHFNKDRAFSSFGKHDPMDKLPNFRALRRNLNNSSINGAFRRGDFSVRSGG
jgi:ribosomal protein S27AE